MNFSTEKKIMDLENRLVVAKGRQQEQDGWVLQFNRCRLLPLEWINNEILLCSTGNYVWSLMMEHDNVRKKECTHVRVTGSPCCTVEN